MPATIKGLGGVFLRASDPEALYQWYEKHFGLVRQHGCFFFQDDIRPEANNGGIAFTFFKREDAYFPTTQPVMINFRVHDIDAALASLAAAGVAIDPKREDAPYGRFAWITDPENNRIELWDAPSE
jgi:predicted enzyme related to lactoylglutathione lyase